MPTEGTPRTVLTLIERFENNYDAYTSTSYNETQVRREFIDPFFKALGWDIDNEQGYAEAYKDVIHEDAIKIGEATKAPDYCFRIGGTRKFFLEAKKPAIDVKSDVNPAFQLRRYAWTTKLPLSILCNFKEFVVYDCRVKPDHQDKASVARILYIPYTDYVTRWHEIVSVFSRDAVLKGSFDKYAETTKAKRGTADVDEAFLQTIETWRKELAENLALRNKKLSQRELNFAVQRIIDRIVFLRICEGRGIEDYGRLRATGEHDQIYLRLGNLFRQADDRYNSGLFHFRSEQGRHEAPDELTLGLALDDKLLRRILNGLYYPESPYVFSALPADMLGQVYEQFLGKIIRLTEGHHAKVDDKPEVKKAGGVFYTPTYVVDYIVANTVGRLLDGNTLRHVAKLTILDPACGSGSFLLSAYDFLLKWHLDFYRNNVPTKWAKGNKPTLAVCRTFVSGNLAYTEMHSGLSVSESMARFVPVDRDTQFLFPPSVQEWLPGDHLARFVVDVVEQLDLAELEQSYAGRGSDAHHPAMLVALLLYGYATGTFSSRALERASYDSIAVRYISANTHPDHDTINSFRKRFLKQIEAIFVQVLGYAQALGMLKLGTVSLDGTKLHANASRHSAMSYGHAKKAEAKLKAEVAELMRRAEAANAKDLPEGLSLPEELSRREERLAAIAAAKAQIEARAKAEAEAAHAAKLAAREQRAKKRGKRPGGRPPAPPSGPPADKEQVNFTDADSRIMPVPGGGFEQAYNAQAAVDTGSMLVVAQAVTQATNDKQQVVPMLERLQGLPEDLGRVKRLLADSGYASEDNVNACAQAKIEPLIALGREAHYGGLFERFTNPAPLPPRPTPLAAMRHRLQTRRGRKLYALRKCTVEPVFGLIKRVLKFRQFSLRGITGARGEWTLVCLAWNVKRMNALFA